MKFKTIIVDDETLARQRIIRLLTLYSDSIEIIAEANNGEQAILLIDELQPDLVFLDIEMPIYNGFEVLKKITSNPLIIFTTAYENYAIKAFENNSIDYLLKPIEKDRLSICMDKLRKQNIPKIDKEILLREIGQDAGQKNNGPQAIPVKLGDRTILIRYDDIVYFEASEKYVEINTIQNNKHIVEFSLNQLSSKLPPNFLRIHRSFLANMNQVKEFRKGFNGAAILVMNNKEESKLHTGRTYIEAVRKWIEW